jgi:uncharacterized protein (DUF58 family)
MKPSAEALLQQLEWTSLKRLDGLLQGDYRTLFRGFGIDLSGVREYQFHDDVRHIDWNVTARLQVPHVREYTEDREITAWFLVDATGSMQFGSNEERKSEVLARHIGLLARLLNKHGNRTGALIYRGEHRPVQVIPAGSGRQRVLLILDALLKDLNGANQAASGSKQVSGSTNSVGSASRSSSANAASYLGQFLNRCGSIIKRRSLLFFASDLQSEDDWQGPLNFLAKRHELIVLQARDALEAELPNMGVMVLRDAETGEEMVVDTSDPKLRARFAELREQENQRIAGYLDQFEIDRLMMGTDEALIGFARRRAQRKQGLRR